MDLKEKRPSRKRWRAGKGRWGRNADSKIQGGPLKIRSPGWHSGGNETAQVAPARLIVNRASSLSRFRKSSGKKVAARQRNRTGAATRRPLRRRARWAERPLKIRAERTSARKQHRSARAILEVAIRCSVLRRLGVAGRSFSSRRAAP